MVGFRSAAALLFSALASLSYPSQGALQFWYVGDINDVEMYHRLASDFEKKEGVKVDVTALSWGSFNAKYFAAMAAGLPPDVGVTNLGGPFEYGAVGGLVDLRSEFREDSKALEAAFDPNLLKIFQIDHKLFGVPSDITTLVIYYRTDIFKELGLTPPKTWSELDAVIAKLEASGYQYYFGFTADAQWAASIYTMPYGLPGIHFDGSGKPAIDWLDPKYQKGIFEAVKLWDMHISSGRNLGGRALGMFASDDKATSAPMMFDLPGTASQIHITQPGIDGKWAIAPWPKADDGQPYNVVGGTSYVILRKSKMQKEAMAWLRYLNSVDIQEQMILNHAARGESASLMVSSVNAIWSPENDAFWHRPELVEYAPLHDVLAQVMPTFKTVRSVHGSVEAGRMEANLLDAMATFVGDRLQAAADQLNVSKMELIRGFAMGKWLDRKSEIEGSIQEKLAADYAKITPEALAKVNEETQGYMEKYGDIIPRLDAAEKATDALKIAKVVAGVLFLSCVFAVVGLRRLRKHWVSYLFVAPPVILALIFVFVPAAVAVYLSLTQYHPVLPLSTARWVGVSNYSELVTSGDLASSLKRTVYYSLMTVPVGIVLALIFAYLLNYKLRGQKIWRFLYFCPLVTSVVSIALIFSQLFLSARQGWLNALLLSIGAVKDPVPFLTSERTFLQCVIVLAIWHGLAFTILVFLAGFQQVPNELHEAAAVDGAGAIRRFWNVAVPGIRPQIFFISVLGVIGAFQVFETIYMLANKSGDAGARMGPNDSAMTVVPLLYHYGFETFEMGKAAALAYVLFVIILIITWMQMRLYRRGEG